MPSNAIITRMVDFVAYIVDVDVDDELSEEESEEAEEDDDDDEDNDLKYICFM
jgi:hypothetical protein